MKQVSIRAFRSVIGTKSFFIVLILLSGLLSAAEVTRSLSLEDKVRILEQQLSAANRMRAESQFEITSLINEIRQLRGLVEEQGYQIQQIVTRQRELYRDIDKRLGKAGNNETTTVSDQTDTTGTGTYTLDTYNSNNQVIDQNAIKADSVTTNSVATDSLVTNEQQIRTEYDQIFQLVKSKRFDEAIAGFQQFIASYPDSIFVANSKYWLAQIYSVQGRTDEAEREYLSVVQQYSTSSKAADAWLKLGKLYEQQGQIDKALNAFNQVVTQYNNSTAAQMAINRLQALKAGN